MKYIPKYTNLPNIVITGNHKTSSLTRFWMKRQSSVSNTGETGDIYHPRAKCHLHWEMAGFKSSFLHKPKQVKINSKAQSLKLILNNSSFIWIKLFEIYLTYLYFGLMQVYSNQVITLSCILCLPKPDPKIWKFY